MNFFGLLGIVFITLKLTHFIDWSWWYVLLPIYGGILLMIFIMVFGLVITAFFGNTTSVRRRR